MTEDLLSQWTCSPSAWCSLSSAELYPPLIATLVALTSPPFDPPPEIIFSYKVYTSL